MARAATLALLALAAAAGLAAAEEHAVLSARCDFEATRHNEGAVTGSMTFAPAAGGAEGVAVSYSVTGLAVGAHSFHVHRFGDVFGTDGGQTGGHFVGECVSCRPDAPQEAGRIGNGTHNIEAALVEGVSVASGSFEDRTATLNGLNSVVGHSIVIHAVGASTRVAQCVVGATFDAAATVAEEKPVTTAATCNLRPTAQANGAPIGGLVRLHRNEAKNATDVSYFLRGLGNGTTFTLAVNRNGVLDLDSAVPLDVFTGLGAEQEADETGVAAGFFQLVGGAPLAGEGNVIGRAIVLHEPGSTAVLATCVVGSTEFGEPAMATEAGEPAVPLLLRAEATLRVPSPNPIAAANSSVAAARPLGLVQFDLLGGDDAPGVRVRYVMTGLPPGNHSWSVRVLGLGCSLDGEDNGDVFAPTLDLGVGRGHFINADEDGYAAGNFKDLELRMSGDDSVVGRTVAVYGTGSSGIFDTVIAYGVVGRAEEHATLLQPDRAAATAAACRLEATGNDPNEMMLERGVSGFVSLSPAPGGGEGLLVKYEVRGLTPNATHAWHVHDWGRTLDQSKALSTGGHFIGTCVADDCRTVEVGQEVGLLNDATPIVADSYGTASGVFVDSALALTGVNSIVGRAIVVHGANGESFRVAQCVLGAVSEAASPEPPACAEAMNEDNFEREVHSAKCQLLATPANAGEVDGSFTVTREASGLLTLGWDVSGLSNGGHRVTVHEHGTELAALVGDQLYELLDATEFTVAAGDATATKNNLTAETGGAALWGAGSIVGRSVVVWGTGEDGAEADTAAAVCVVGRLEDETVEAAHPLAPRAPRVKRAVARLWPTGAATSAEGVDDTAAGGWVEFLDADVNDPAAKVRVRVFAYGLPGDDDETRLLQVHDQGALDNGNANDIGSVFTGTCDDCRGDDAPVQAVGSVGAGYALEVRGGVASGFVSDSVLKLSGLNSVVGRSVAVWSGDETEVHLRGVIGGVLYEDYERLPPHVELDSGVDNTADPPLGEDEQTPDDPDEEDPSDEGGVGSGAPPRNTTVESGVPYVTAATARLQATDDSPAPAREGAALGGVVDFRLDFDTEMVEVSFQVYGLEADTEYYVEVRTHGNLCGDEGANTGDRLESMCTPTVNSSRCRPAVGGNPDTELLGYFAASPVTTNEYGLAEGVFWDAFYAFNGPRSILGRSVVVYREVGTVVAAGVVGRLEETTRRLQNPAFPRATKAACQLRPTAAAEGLGYENATGFAAFSEDPDGGGVVVELYMTGVPPGAHTWHVHDLGDALGWDKGLAVGGHFVGQSPMNRRAAGAQEIGSINNGQSVLVSSGGVAFEEFRDSHLTLYGVNSIVGRSVIVHGDGAADGAVRILQCVLGVASEEADRAPFPQCDERLENPEQAVCTMRPTTAALAADPDGDHVHGEVSFVRLEDEYRVAWAVHNLDEGSHAVSVLERGNIFMPDGSLSGDTFQGTLGGRAVGALDASFDMADGETVASGTAIDTDIRLRGVNSVVGRTLVVHATASRSSAVVASCVIGRADDALAETVPDEAATRVARADLQPADGVNKGGWMTFRDLGGDAGVEVRYWLWGVDGSYEHETHVHQRGDLRDASGTDVGGHFVGSCADEDPGCRGADFLAEIGFMGDGHKMFVHDGATSGYFVDQHLRLNGPDSIVGRSVIVHGSLFASDVKVAMGVIGIAETGPEPSYDERAGVSSTDSPPQALEASVVLRETSLYAGTSGVFDFAQAPGASTGATIVSYSVYGLLPGVHRVEVHKHGDLCADDGSSLGGLASSIQWTGNLTVGADLVATGHFSTDELTLYGSASVVGHSLVVLGTAADSGAIAASGVIGRGREHASNLMPALELTTYAACRLEPTYQITNPARPVELFGYVFFTYVAGEGVRVRYQVRNLPGSAELPWHVHLRGDLVSPASALATKGHFVGDCDSCRPGADKQEVGLINFGEPIETSSFGTSRGDFVDPVLRLNGPNGIVGRSVVVHADGAPDRIAQCVIGRRAEPPSAEDEDVCELLVLHVDPSEESSSSGLSSGTVAVIATASVVSVLLLIGAVVVCLGIRRNRAAAKGTRMTAAAGSTGTDAKDVELGSSYAGTAAAGTAAAGGAAEGGAALPPGWEEHVDDEQNVYYYNVHTQESVWEPPTA